MKRFSRLLASLSAAACGLAAAWPVSAAALNPSTGDEGINPVIWIVLGIAVVAIVVAALVPALSKKKGDKPPRDNDRRDR